ncbi:MAG TPA: YHS domain-containing protein [Armatimonadota bacterium]|nr:YHS domain-containing protein [Armatimonadota bacterium]
MKIRTYLPALLVAPLFAGALAAKPGAALAAPRKAPCTVCSVKEGAGPEAVRATATYAGREYPFCSEDCKQQFLANPQIFLTAQAPPPPPAGSASPGRSAAPS